MPIKFACPACERKLAVKDELAGKKGKCPGCGSVLTIPQVSRPPQPAVQPSSAAPVPGGESARQEAPPPELPPESVEEAAAAALADEPPAEPEEPQTLSFECPMCGEAVEVGAELAGKRTPCPSPECRRIIQVPELKKKDRVSWAKQARLPSGARLPDEPPPEGAWGTGTQSARVSLESLEEADALPVEKEPVTWGMRVRRGLWILGSLAAVLLIWSQVSSWRFDSRQQQTIEEALALAETLRPGPPRASLHRLAGEYHILRKQEGSAPAAVEQLDAALGQLREASGGVLGGDRDLALLDLALTWVDLGGDDLEVRDELALSWDDVHRRLRATLQSIRDPESREEALRRVSQRLIARQQAQRVLPLAAQLFSEPQTRREVQATLGVELYLGGEKEEATKVARLVLGPYRGETPPPVDARVVALAELTGQKPPEAPKGSLEKESEVAGRAEGLAWLGRFDEARKLLVQATYPQYQLRLLLPIAAAGAEGGERGDVEAALRVASLARGRTDVSPWQLLRLVELTIQVGLPEEQQKQAASLLLDRAFQGRAQLLILRARLASSSGVVDAALLDQVSPGQGAPIRSLSHALAALALARHNVQQDPGWRTTVDSWDEPLRAFGAMGIALGLREEG